MKQKAISLVMALVMLLTLIPFGSFSAAANQEYTITCTECQATDIDKFVLIKAEAGTKVYLVPNNVTSGMYCTGYTAQESDVEINGDNFIMPAHEVNITAHKAAKKDYTFDLTSGSANVNAEILLEMIKYIPNAPVVSTDESIDGAFDLDGDKIGDIEYSSTLSKMFVTQNAVNKGISAGNAVVENLYSPLGKLTFNFKGGSQPTEKYTVIWQFEDGTELGRYEGVSYGSVVNFPTTPVKPSTMEYEYEFVRWSPAEGEITKNTVYTAIFEQKVRTRNIIWKNYNGTVLKKETILATTKPAYTGKTPTRAADSKYTYTFAGWSSTVDKATGDTVFTAVFNSKAKTHTVTWKNYNGTVLQKDVVPTTEKAVYKGKTPKRAADSKYTYTFSGWSSTTDKKTGDIVNTAKYTKKAISISLTAKAKTFKAKTKTKKYSVTLKINKKAASKKKLTLTVGGKTYTAKTNSKGVATFSIKKLTKKGKYTGTVLYKGSPKNVSKKVVITVK